MSNAGSVQGIGEENLPASLRNSRLLSAKNIRLLASVAEMPVIDPGFEDGRLKNIFHYYAINPQEMEKELHQYAEELLDAGHLQQAWQVLLTLD
jgi:hypothetical protein